MRDDDYDDRYGDTDSGGWFGGVCIVLAIAIILVAVVLA